MSDNLTCYLAAFTEKAQNAGLPVRHPGKNWSPLEPLDQRSHVSLSVTRHRIQVNLNNENDDEGTKLARLHADRVTIEEEVGETLLWEKKDGRRKTTVRATINVGYADEDWDRQHAWAIGMMRQFQRSFGVRLD
ncbi:DUF4268 domain-containing protein [Glacieibacterium megasporae]|uniref:DUF4268 domain-containing protein n=1 Tax=Glacieibacterium megasporae TaxID=2835787 RepID=UPI001C1E8429|nr:DUF4268 domain-containing protein [Polymorphobacter megasporae]UAJ12655.1 DUF4268 domain-containing protein [Polymorphobacter megasporae]